MMRCYFKNVAESWSREGELMRIQYDYIDYHNCRIKCDGHNSDCEFYELREMNELEEETVEDSSIGAKELSKSLAVNLGENWK